VEIVHVGAILGRADCKGGQAAEVRFRTLASRGTPWLRRFLWLVLVRVSDVGFFRLLITPRVLKSPSNLARMDSRRATFSQPN
jgi:hypothetical protein